MEDLWENWISSLEMDGDKSLSLDKDKFLIENVQEPSFPFENANNSQSPTIVDNVCVTKIHEKMLNTSNSSKSPISQEFYDTTNSKQLAPSQFILSFENTTMEPSPNSAAFFSIMDNNVRELPKVKQRTRNVRRSPEIQEEHIIAERKRRQVISERFIALSAIIPGLKKTDKIHILGETLNYVKQLQEKVKELENHQNKRKKDDSVIIIKISDEHGHYSNQELPKVEARVIEKEILIGIHCEKQNDIVVGLMALLQNLHLSLASSSVLPFGTSTLKVTIIAQMDDDFCMSMDDLVKNLRQYLLESRT